MTDHDEKDAKGELLPCPFCGGAAHLSSVAGWHAVGCVSAQTCPAYLRTQTHRTEAGAVAAWNRRPSTTPTFADRYSKPDTGPSSDGFPYG